MGEEGRKEEGQTGRVPTHPPTCTSKQDFGRTIRGKGGSPAPDKGHDRLAARCSVELCVLP